MKNKNTNKQTKNRTTKLKIATNIIFFSLHFSRYTVLLNVLHPTKHAQHKEHLQQPTTVWILYAYYENAVRFGINNLSNNIQNLLRWFEVSVNDLVQVKVVHAACDTHGPVNEQWWCDLSPCSQNLIQLPLCTVLHDYAVTWSLCAHTPKTQAQTHTYS